MDESSVNWCRWIRPKISNVNIENVWVWVGLNFFWNRLRGSDQEKINQKSSILLWCCPRAKDKYWSKVCWCNSRDIKEVVDLLESRCNLVWTCWLGSAWLTAIQSIRHSKRRRMKYTIWKNQFFNLYVVLYKHSSEIGGLRP